VIDYLWDSSDKIKIGLSNYLSGHVNLIKKFEQIIIDDLNPFEKRLPISS